MMNLDPNDIDNRLRQEILAPFVVRFRTFSAISLSLWPLNYFAALLTFRYGFGMDGREAIFAAVGGMVLLGIVDTVAFGILLANTVKEAGNAFLQLFPQGSTKNIEAMNSLASEKSSAAKSLYKYLALHAETGPDQPDAPMSRETAVMPVRQETGSDDLIDLNAPPEASSRNG